jgi:NhaP-type Na+/H+ or K+/H+ antiporter
MSDPVLMAVLVLAVGIGAQWLAWRTRLPAIILLAIGGLLIGPVTGLLPHGHEIGSVVHTVVALCVAIILFEGGLNLQRSELRVAAKGVRRLVYLGAPLAWLFGALAAHYIADLSWPVSVVFGAIMIVTGPTVIMPLLRQAGLRRSTSSYLKWEGIINDPIGALAAVLSYQFFIVAGTGESWAEVSLGVLAALVVAVTLGGVGGWLTGHAFRRGLIPEYLKSPVMLTMVLLVYEISNLAQHEAGLLTVTVMGIVVGNMHLSGLQDMKRFKEYITIILVSVVFVLLTATMDPDVVRAVDLKSVLLVAAIMFLVRPAAVMLATAGAGMELRERLLLAWIAPRGIVAAATAGVMGPALAERGFEGAEALLPLTFGVIFATVVAHGLTLGWLSRRLGLSSPERDSVLIVGASPWTIELAGVLKALDVKAMIADRSWHRLRPARQAGVPTFYGEILSEFAEESVEVGQIRTVLAATDNDAYNALVCSALAPEVGRGRVFQLPMGPGAEDDPKGVSITHRGRIAFGDGAEFENLWGNLVKGWVFTKTPLTEAYTFESFKQGADPNTLSILLHKADGHTRFLSSQSKIDAGPGDILVCFGPPRPADAPGRAGDRRDTPGATGGEPVPDPAAG